MSDKATNTRIGILIGVCLAMFAILAVRLLELQIILSREYKAKSEANSVRLIEVLPGRGLISDRWGKIIVENHPAYSLSIIPYEARNSPETYSELSYILSKPVEEVHTLVNQQPGPGYLPVKFARDLNFQALAAYRARALDLIGVEDQFDPKRYFTYPVAPHAIGYIGEISEAEKKKFPNRKTGDIVGKSGIERKYDDLLAGQKGYRYMIVNALGQISGELEDKYVPPQSSGKLLLSMDLDLQMIAEAGLMDHCGAVVALDPNNGELLAITSAPKYNPEKLTGVIRLTDWQDMQNDPGVPLLNRATQSGYPAASTFKMAILSAALEEGIITPNYTYYCPGYYNLGRVYHCFKKEGHGTLNVYEAIEQSCDAFFYRLGHRLGVETIGKYLKMYGFGSPTGVDIENEVSGIAPTKEYMDKRYGKGKWSFALALNIAIGQGETLVTPIQLAQYCGILATAGTKAKPHLFMEMRQNDGEVIRFKPEIKHVDISRETFAIVREGMRRVVEGSRGTARAWKDPRWEMAGKTGTAQNPHGKDHALFIGFAPFDHPIIAVAVVVENVGFGSQFAAPIGMKIMSRYLEIMGVPPVPGAKPPAYMIANEPEPTTPEAD
ncbi:MAG: penicillin-binding protein 2 [bacterium]|nr:penicillin-binding protein 2 [bacterium]